MREGDWASVTLLRARRLEQGLTGKTLAQRCRELGVPVSPSEVSRIERHIHTPRPALRRALAEVLGLTVMDFECGIARGDRGGHGGVV